MKTQESVSRILAARRKPRRSSFQFGEKIADQWNRLTSALKRHPNLIYRILLAIPILWVLFDFASFSFGTLPARPQAIHVTGMRRMPADTVRTEIFRKLRTSNADNLIEVDLSELADYLVRQIPAIRSATVTMNVGRGIMTVAVTERAGVAIIQNSSGMLEVDREGMLYTVESPKIGALPVVTNLAGSTIRPGRNLYEHPSGAGIVRMVTSTPSNLRVKTIRPIRPDYFELTLADGTLVKSDPASFPFKSEKLAHLVRKNDRPVSYIDLRFQQDVISYKAASGSEPSSDESGKNKGR